MTDLPGSAAQGEPERGDGKVSIALIEDNRVLREGLTALLNAVPELSVVHVGSGIDLSHIRRIKPNVLLLDAGLENGDSLSVARTVSTELPESRVVVMDLLPAEQDIRAFIGSGVHGFVSKDATVDQLVSTIRSVAAGAHVLPSTMTTALFSQIAANAVTSRGMQAEVDVRLTPRERSVIDLISEGLSNKAIADRLHISVHTVKSHVSNIMEKLTLRTRLQLAAWAHREDEETS